MALDIIVPGVSFIANAIEFDLIVTDGLAGLFIPVADNPNAARNFGPAGSNGSLVGTPTIHDGGQRFNAAAYIDTGLPETAEITAIVVGKTPDAMSGSTTRPCYVGNYGSPNYDQIAGTYGFQMSMSADTTVSCNAAHFNDAGGASATTGSRTLTVESGWASQWNMAAFMANDETNSIYTPKTQASSNAVSYDYGRTISTGTLRVGANYAGFGNADVAMAAIFDRVLSTAEVDQIYAQMQTLLNPLLSNEI